MTQNQLISKRLKIVHAKTRYDFIRYPDMFHLFKAHGLIEDRGEEIARINKQSAESNSFQNNCPCYICHILKTPIK